MVLARGNDQYHAIGDGVEFVSRTTLANNAIRREMWQVCTSGLIFMMHDAWEDDDAGGPADHFIHAGLTVTHIAQGVALMVSLYEALAMNDELVTFATALLGVRGRPLLVTPPGSTTRLRANMTDTRCAIDAVQAELTWPLAKWRSDLREQTRQLAEEILTRCNWLDVPDYFIRDHIAWLFDTPR